MQRFHPKSVELPGRLRLPYVERGNPSGIPMLLLHGVTDSWRSFEPVLPHLPDRVHAFALTQRGHSDADRPVTGYRTRDFAADLAAFVRALELGPTIVVGHSMGSTNALRLALDHPELVAGLVLAGAFASYQRNPVMKEFWESSVSRLTDPVPPAFVREFQESTLAKPVPPAFLDLVIEESLKVPARVWRATFEGFSEDDFAGELDRVRAPTLLLWGDQERLVPREDQDVLQRAISGSRLVVYEGAGHALHWEEPERFAADLAVFAADLTTPS